MSSASSIITQEGSKGSEQTVNILGKLFMVFAVQTKAKSSASYSRYMYILLMLSKLGKFFKDLYFLFSSENR